MEPSWKQKFFIIAGGQMISLIGSSAVQFALIWWIASETGSALLLGLSGLVAFLPGLVLSPWAGVLADRQSRKPICILADISIGAVALGFALLMWAVDVPVWTAILVLLLRSVGQTFHQPALQAMIPQLVPREYLIKANGWSQMMNSGSFILGPVVGAALYAAFPLPAVLLSDLVGAAAASGLLAAVRVPRAAGQGRSKRRFREEFREGIRVYLADKRLFLLVMAASAAMVFYLPLSSLYPLMTSGYFRATAWHASAVEGAYAVGMMGAAFLFGSVLRIKRHIWAAYAGLLGIGISSAICGLLPPDMWAWWIFLFACGAMGGCVNVMGIPATAYMQKTIAPEKLGRAFSLMTLLSSVAMPLGLLVAGPMAERIGVHIWFLVTGLGVTVIALAAMFWNYRMKTAQQGDFPAAPEKE